MKLERLASCALTLTHGPSSDFRRGHLSPWAFEVLKQALGGLFLLLP